MVFELKASCPAVASSREFIHQIKQFSRNRNMIERKRIKHKALFLTSPLLREQSAFLAGIGQSLRGGVSDVQ